VACRITAPPDPWSCTPSRKGYKRQDLGSVNAPPPLDHRDSGVGWSSYKLQASGRKQCLTTVMGY